MCRFLTDDEFEVVANALQVSVEMDDYGQTLGMLDLQDKAFAIVTEARRRSHPEGEAGSATEPSR